MSRIFSYLARAVAALPREVLPMNQRAGGSTALKREPRIDERGGTGVVVDKKCLALMIMFHFPAPRQLQLFVCEHVEESHKVPVMLVAFKVVGIPPDFGDHVLQTRVVCKHAVGTRVRMQHGEELWADEELHGGRL